ncbi:CRISPR system precrRNA processing endoribonuclease RAMP protein Cas6 [Bacillus sp. DTU_2020_1000418_1_SI_GHA_SEK_038]|uniref:CRISPR system precrRNA processing endoribonuclease RAMP protein Cas6 n=1 Tax=Bacillus sp. DTU_2020_1000418_1_SI_GHA_SEK_038 TaxID=3077585 RepID=UPI0028E5109B|nr:CRISPR system precrRNA processing endoribonuclease RAMP protein Cas6 [Bacillus sp. DTU_2020_1000418_1_SI_GHA_SEK_038]WNS77435.1 CRISPR system precrRNA processing endoribonuclease RAMP protein Cas6 [Bacillus sp. DTU_2020_1000418_1_SI_GHA_SEK_038]
MEIYDLIQRMSIGHIIVTYELLEDGVLPSFKGSTFRGLMGHALRETACPSCAEGGNSECLYGKGCMYKQIFESPNLQGGFAPHPFVMRCNDYRTEWKAGDRISFELITISFLNDMTPELCQCFEKMGQIGLGASRLAAKLKKVEAYNDEQITSSIYIDGNIECKKIPAKQLELEERNEVIIEFITPARITHQGRLQKTLTYSIIMKSITSRVNQIASHYYPELYVNIRAEQDVVANKVYDFLQAASIERYSNRKSQKMRLDGLIGLQKYEGTRETYHLLKFAELIHIGKSTSMGFGKIKIWK